MITLTDALRQHLARMIAHRTPKEQCKSKIVLDVTTTGCSGLAYKFTYKDVPLSSSSTVDDLEITPGALAVLNGATIDYVTEGLSSGIKIINPNEASKCGCGESFNV